MKNVQCELGLTLLVMNLPLQHHLTQTLRVKVLNVHYIFTVSYSAYQCSLGDNERFERLNKTSWCFFLSRVNELQRPS